MKKNTEREESKGKEEGENICEKERLNKKKERLSGEKGEGKIYQDKPFT